MELLQTFLEEDPRLFCPPRTVRGMARSRSPMITEDKLQKKSSIFPKLPSDATFMPKDLEGMPEKAVPVM